MTKRHRFESHSSHSRHEKTHNVEPLYGSKSPWDPLNQPGFDRRDQSYIRKIKPQNANQSALIDAMAQNNVVVAVGPAGTGKTYLAISAAVEALEEGRVDRIILSRPAVEAGETIGFLPELAPVRDNAALSSVEEEKARNDRRHAELSRYVTEKNRIRNNDRHERVLLLSVGLTSVFEEPALEGQKSACSDTFL